LILFTKLNINKW